MKKYVFRPGFHIRSVTPGDAWHELNRIRESRDGQLHARDVVDESRPNDAPLHPVFEWDDAEAAEQYREHQARTLIRSVKVVVEAQLGEPPRQVRAFVRDESGYASAADVAMDEDRRDRHVRYLLGQMQAAANELEEFRALCASFEGASAYVRRLRTEFDNRPGLAG